LKKRDPLGRREIGHNSVIHTETVGGARKTVSIAGR